MNTGENWKRTWMTLWAVALTVVALSVGETLAQAQQATEEATASILVEPIGDQLGAEGTEVRVPVVVAAIEGMERVLTYSITGQPDGVEINPETGLITGIIARNAATGGLNGDGDYIVTVTVEEVEETETAEDSTAVGTASFTWQVLDGALAPRAYAFGPVVTDADGDGVELITLSGFESSDDVELVEYTWSLPDGTVIGQEDLISHEFPVGETEVWLVVRDELGLTDIDNVVVNVRERGQVGTFAGFTLIDAGTEEPVEGYNPIPHGSVIDLAELPDDVRLNFRANVGATPVRQVQFQLAGPISRIKVEEGAPYTVFGDSGYVDFFGVELEEGHYTLVGVPDSDLTAAIGIGFTVINSERTAEQTANTRTSTTVE